jgi:hypothetical protein
MRDVFAISTTYDGTSTHSAFRGVPERAASVPDNGMREPGGRWIPTFSTDRSCQLRQYNSQSQLWTMTPCRGRRYHLCRGGAAHRLVRRVGHSNTFFSPAEQRPIDKPCQPARTRSDTFARG